MLFAPLYYANVCVNNCLYCGFRSGNPSAARRVLDPREIEAEALALLRMGHRRLLLVASEDPSRSGRELLLAAAHAVRRVRFDGASIEHVGMEVAPGGMDLFRAMAEAGVDSYTLFQETYDRRIYAIVHPDGPKRGLRPPHRCSEPGALGQESAGSDSACFSDWPIPGRS